MWPFSKKEFKPIIMCRKCAKILKPGNIVTEPITYCVCSECKQNEKEIKSHYSLLCKKCSEYIKIKDPYKHGCIVEPITCKCGFYNYYQLFPSIYYKGYLCFDDISELKPGIIVAWKLDIKPVFIPYEISPSKYAPEVEYLVLKVEDLKQKAYVAAIKRIDTVGNIDNGSVVTVKGLDYRVIKDKRNSGESTIVRFALLHCPSEWVIVDKRGA